MQAQKKPRIWSMLSKEEKKKCMQPAMKARWKDVSDRKRKAHAKKMAIARWGKITK